MKRLAMVILVLALGWGGFWLWGQQALKADFERWFGERRDAGWQAAYGDMSIRGFPNRHDTTWTEIEIADPDSGLGWRAPFFQLFLLSYDWHHAILIWPDRQVIVTPEGEVTVTSERLHASVVTEGAAHLLERANLVADVLNVTAPDGGTTALAQLRGALTRRGEAGYDLSLAADGLALPAGWIRATGGALPETFSRARLKADVRFDAPWTLGAAQTRPQPRRIALSVAELEWGPMALRMTGDLEIDRKGRASGDVHLQAQNWRDMLAVARGSGALPAVVLDGMETALALMAQVSGNRASLDVTLRLEEGRIRLGPLPLGEAPRIRLR